MTFLELYLPLTMAMITTKLVSVIIHDLYTLYLYSQVNKQLKAQGRLKEITSPEQLDSYKKGKPVIVKNKEDDKTP